VHDDGPRDKPREATAGFGDSVQFEDFFDAKIATKLHPLLLDAAVGAARRAADAAGADYNVELREACIAVLSAAVAVETATHWAADLHGDSLLERVQEGELPNKWLEVVEVVTGVRHKLGEGLGQAVGQLSNDRNRLAHFPSRKYKFFGPPQRRSGGRSEVRSVFTATRAKTCVATASEAIRALGLPPDEWQISGDR
jgi:hypothetical protein